ncbi:hypothetical protein ACJRO7_018666 [Eucalyptus globulus]|uniref:Neprosin PEP catalytic domain-containing protein n=1 Tax=Eucalyptus globulus TaxID=34317 RepID=A0ABD3KVE6_EUCGL
MALKQVVFVLVLLPIYRCRATNISKDYDIELEEQLKLLNKPPIETFLTEEGDTIDCVDIDKQLALNHPLLKNHKVQYMQFRLRKSCPIGTVNPDVGGDNLAQLITYWMGNGWRNGCYNINCAGFVQVDRTVTLNYPIPTVSKDGGPIYELKIDTYQDRVTGNWWLRVHDPPVDVGHWPKALFNFLQDGTSTVAWGGTAKESEDGNCPAMGNGELPNEDYRKAAYFRQVQWRNADGSSLPPCEGMPEDVEGPPICYGLLSLHHRSDPWGYSFSFGGPGGYCRA